EAILKDAVDVFERKLQILERKGFLGTLPGRRRALDRLLPTIRAAADPITQELYMSRAAEAAGVRKEGLEGEVTNAGAGSGERYPSARSAGTVSTGENRSPLPAPALPASAEKTLLLLLLEGEPWKSKVIQAVDAEEFEFVPYREAFEAIADDAVLSLSETSARAYEELRAEGLGDRDPNALYERAVKFIEARRRERQLEQIDQRLPFETPEVQAALSSKAGAPATATCTSSDGNGSSGCGEPKRRPRSWPSSISHARSWPKKRRSSCARATPWGKPSDGPRRRNRRSRTCGRSRRRS